MATETRTDTPRITLITPTPPDISAFGVRALSAYLKSKKYSVTCIFLPGGIERLTHGGEYRYTYSDKVLQQIIEITGDSAVAGISFMSQYRDRAIALTRALRERTQAMIVWGGIHAEVDPGDCLQHADAVCLDEGEYILEKLLSSIARGETPGTMTGLITTAGQLHGTPACPPLISDLDELPVMDIGPDDHWLLDPRAGDIVPMSPDRMRTAMPLMPAPGGGAFRVYRTMTSRGCPHRCTYCANRVKAANHPGESYLRFRSPFHVITELKTALATYPFIEGVHFFDDVFTAMPADDLERLCRDYHREIGLPFYAQASPSTLTRDQLDMMIETGLVFMDLGIQTGSDTIRRMYRRPETNAQILSGTRLIDEYRRKGLLLTPHYHVILDNPWETREDVQATLDLLTRIPGTYKLCLASLTFYPGTDLCEKAISEHLIQDMDRDVYRKPFYIPKGRYLNYLIYLADIHWIPRGVLRWMGNAPARIFDRPVYGPFFDMARRVTDKLRLAGKGVTALWRGQLHRIIRYFKRVK